MFADRSLLKRKKKGTAKQDRARRDAARRQQKNARLRQERRGRAAVRLQSFVRQVCARRRLFQSTAKWCIETLQERENLSLTVATTVLRSVMWCQQFASTRQGQRGTPTAATCVDDIAVRFARRIDPSSLELMPSALFLRFSKLCVDVLQRSQNLDVIPVLARISQLPPKTSGELVAGCIPRIFAVGTTLGLRDPAGSVIRKIVCHALQAQGFSRVIAPWFLALWLSEPDAGPLFRTSVAVTELLPHVSEAAEILEQRSNKDDQNAAPMHRLAQNLLSMLVVARQDSLHRLSSSSFHVHAAKLFWRVNLHSPRCLTSFEEDVLDQDDEFDEDSSASDEPLDLTDEFDLARSRRIYASLRRHHRQIDAKSFCSPIHPRDLRDDDTVFQYFFDVEKWQQLAETDFASASPDFLWSVPVSVLIARKAMFDLNPIALDTSGLY